MVHTVQNVGLDEKAKLVIIEKDVKDKRLMYNNAGVILFRWNNNHETYH